MKKLAALVLAAAMATSVGTAAKAQPVPASLAAAGGLTTGVVIGGVLFLVTVIAIVDDNKTTGTTQ